jgi:hypothetical protein
LSENKLPKPLLSRNKIFYASVSRATPPQLFNQSIEIGARRSTIFNNLSFFAVIKSKH